MKRDIHRCSVQFLASIFMRLEQQNPDYVFWIRDASMTQQIYHSGNFTKFWGCQAGLIYDMPMLWINFLEQTGLNGYMSQLQDRHNHDYLIAEKNTIFYQVTRLDGFNSHMKDHCFRCKCPLGREYIAGISKNSHASSWHEEYRLAHAQWLDDDKKVHRDFLQLLSNHFGLKPIAEGNDQKTQVTAYREDFAREFRCKLSRRELECLYYLCQGDTAKRTAQRLDLSARTIEKHLDNVRIKTGNPTKLALIVAFSQYFLTLPTLE